MDDALHWRMGMVADGVVALLGAHVELGWRRHELPRDGVGRIGAVDQGGDMGRDRDRVTRRHGVERGRGGGRHETGGDEVGEGAQGHCSPPATGVHSTSSIRRAPVSSITSRSRPRAMPLVSGIRPSAARKSSSSG